jgi:CRISPR-associated protein Cmr2
VSRALLSFSLTPVQSFIEAARSVRDLKSGSALLSHLTLTALEMVESKGGTTIFPAEPAAGWSDHIPNLFLARFDSLDAAETAAEACRNAVQERWEKVADTVRKELGKKLSSSPGWDRGWDYQVEHFWEIQTAALEISQIPTVYQAMLGEAMADPDDLGQQFRAMQAVLASRKLQRHFPGDNGIGRHKCAIMGEWEQMGPVGLNEANKFWEEAAREVSLEGIRLTTRDRLCAPALTKRFCTLDAELRKRVGKKFPDTASIATASWWKAAVQKCKAEAQDFQDAVSALQDALGNTADTERRYLLEMNLTAKRLADESGLAETQIKEPFGVMVCARQDLLAKAKEAKLGTPPRYYAILVQDGDEMGRWLGGEKTEQISAAFLKDMSMALQGYAGSVKTIVGSHDGFDVYTGGDDALYMVPLEKALPCAQGLREDFPEFGTDTDGGKPTLSAGMAIVHYKYDLRSALRAARQAEHNAKTSGRDSLGIELIKRSGGAVGLVLPWCMTHEMLKLQCLFHAGVSDRWLPKTAALGPDLRNWYASCQAVACLIGQTTRGLHLTEEEQATVAGILENCPPKEAAAKTREYLADLWLRTWEMMKSRYDRLRIPSVNEDEFPCDSHSDFPPRVLEAFVAFGLTASFLDRGRD